jgi:hypothetical protein
MLYGFLKSAKPIHYLLTGAMLLAATVMLSLLRGYNVVEAAGVLFVIILCFLVFQFVVAKNELVARSAMGMWVLLWLILACMVMKIDVEALAALLLLLLALRRILSLNSGKSEISKIFDASFWISISCFVNPWYAVLFLLVYMGIFLYARNQMRFWFIPFIAMLCVGFLSFTIGYVFEIPMYRPWENSWALVDLSIVEKGIGAFMYYMLLVLSAVFLFIYAARIVDINKRVPQFLSVLITLVILGAALMVVNHGAPFSAALLTLPAMAIFIGRASYYMEHKGFRELLLWLPVAICAVNWSLYL